MFITGRYYLIHLNRRENTRYLSPSVGGSSSQPQLTLEPFFEVTQAVRKGLFYVKNRHEICFPYNSYSPC